MQTFGTFDLSRPDRIPKENMIKQSWPECFCQSLSEELVLTKKKNSNNYKVHFGNVKTYFIIQIHMIYKNSIWQQYTLETLKFIALLLTSNKVITIILWPFDNKCVCHWIVLLWPEVEQAQWGTALDHSTLGFKEKRALGPCSCYQILYFYLVYSVFKSILLLF